MLPAEFWFCKALPESMWVVLGWGGGREAQAEECNYLCSSIDECDDDVFF